MLQIECCMFLCIAAIAILPTETMAITTIHHDKPVETQPNHMAQMQTSIVVNSTNIEQAERQKRLLPYMTFYLEHDFNQPHAAPQSPPQASAYAPGSSGFATTGARKQPTLLQHYHTKFAEFTNGVGYQPTGKAIPAGSNHKITPFLDSNALPGPFIPMRLHVANKVAPNFSTIYDKLSQLKLQQQYYNSPNVHYTPARVQTQAHLKSQHPHIPFLVPDTYTAPGIDVTSIGPGIYKEVEEDASFNNGDETYNEAVKQPHFAHPSIRLHEQPPPPLPTTGVRGHILPIANGVVKKHLLKQAVLVRQKAHTTGEPILIIQRKPPPSPPEVSKTYDTEVANHGYAPIKYLKYRPQPPVEPKYIDIIPPPRQYNVPQPIPQPPTQPIPPPQIATYQQQQLPSVVEYYARNEPQKKKNKYNSVIELQYPDEVDDDRPDATQTPLVSYVPEFKKPDEVLPKYVYPSGRPVAFTPTIPRSSSTTATPVTLNSAEAIYDEGTNSLSLILKKLQDTNALPQTLTPDNIDNSIRTLVQILSSLKKQPKFRKPIIVSGESEDYIGQNEAGVNLGEVPGTVTQIFPENTPEGGTPGTPGVDYPALSTIPHTNFNCKTQRYKGFFGDPDTNCQVWHYCDLNGGQASFLCPNGTIFSQVALTCDWWYNVKCSNTAQQYVLNERLYKYILPLAPKFPEDYSGPLVDRYLALKFQEMEEKMKKERKENKENENGSQEEQDNVTEEQVMDTSELTSREKSTASTEDSNTEQKGVISAPIIVPDDSNETSATTI